MPPETGITVHEHAARKKLAPVAVEKLASFDAAAPSRCMMASFDMNATMAPARRNAGMRQVRTCSATYSCIARNPATISSKIIGILLQSDPGIRCEDLPPSQKPRPWPFCPTTSPYAGGLVTSRHATSPRLEGCPAQFGEAINTHMTIHSCLTAKRIPRGHLGEPPKDVGNPPISDPVYDPSSLPAGAQDAGPSENGQV